MPVISHPKPPGRRERTGRSGHFASPRGDGARRRIRDAAMDLFEQRPFGDVTVKEIATAAGVFPNQITHHFGSKDALFVGAAFALLLRQSERLRSAGRRASSPEGFGTEMASTAMTMTALPAVVGAMSVARANPSVQPAIQGGLSVLFRQSEGYLRSTLAERGWIAERGVEGTVRTFWSAIFGAVLMARTGFAHGATGADIAAALPIATRPA